MNEPSNKETNLFLEEVACDLIRFKRGRNDAAKARAVSITREMPLGDGETFADILVESPGEPPFFVELKHGRPSEEILARVGAKYGRSGHLPAKRLILGIDREGRPDFEQVVRQLRDRLAGQVELEVWTEAELYAMVGETFDCQWKEMTQEAFEYVRRSIMRAKRDAAFGDDAAETPMGGVVLQHQLLWHFGWWRLAQLRAKIAAGEKIAGGAATVKNLLPPGTYRDAVIVMADLCSFTAYMRDTRDDEVVRESLTMFYSQARYEIINRGGMLYQFLGDGVIGIFGVPDASEGYACDALASARSLINIGRSVADYWQRHIDREQPKRGVHIGLAVGDLQVLPLRPYGRAHIGAVGDSINLAARLMDAAGENEIMVSNTLYNTIDAKSRAQCADMGGVEAHNAGTIRAWKICCGPAGGAGGAKQAGQKK
jgi:class 3 adenylate cyclase